MIDQFENFLKTDNLVKHGLPAFVYTSDAFREIENHTVFTNSWVFVGFAHELGEIGDVQPVTVAGKPFFLVRNDNNEITAFHNVCRHRCLKLIESSGNCGQLIQCPYHSWIYDLQGALKAAPYFGGRDRKPPPGFLLEDHGLVAVSCETWHDWIFIRINGEDTDGGLAFDKFIAPLKKRLENIDLAQIKPVATIDFGVLQTNWKALMENFIEPYHVQFVHKTTTSQPLVDHYTILEDHCLGSGCDIAEDKNKDDLKTLAVSSRFLTLFPNFVIGTYAPDQLGVHLNIPVNAGETRQRRVIYLHKDNPASEKEIQQTRQLWYDVHKQDHAICERLQLGRVSEIAADGGYLSPHWEDSVRRFQELVVESVFPQGDASCADAKMRKNNFYD
ncbi:aromatic ring-hydroxylating oxygenase subunit alpha [Candidatus Spongiihabitans sp.]|uniref:aromatic ring-hydroxylating oxygenase subunit alpha n=1 Tax=Candidatus Spongiihabitans sp. TaxID=3101308 RepID=UPI003C6F36FC